MKGQRAFAFSVVAGLALAAGGDRALAQDMSGFVGVESTGYTDSGSGDELLHRLFGEIEAKGSLPRGLSYQLRLYGSYNPKDSGDSYFDPTIAKLSYTTGSLKLDAGYDIQFWGVNEARNVANFLNQRDIVRDIEGDLALGQPMVAAQYFIGDTSIAGYVLPRFVERNYGADDRRFGFPLPVDDGRSRFESDDGRNHIDWAARVAGYFEDLEYGLAVFDGTLRDPVLQVDPATRTLVPFYQQGTQFAMTQQYTYGATLFKFEGSHVRPDNAKHFSQFVYGAEHVIGGIFGTPYELVFFAEHNVDSRGKDAPSAFQNDLFVGTRLNLLNTQGTTVRLGGFVDLDYGSVFASAVLQTRLTDNLTLDVRAYGATAHDEEDPLFNARDIDQINLKLKWNF